MPAEPSPPPPNLARGASAEQRACDHLVAAGLRLRERNYRTRRGEIDLVMDDARTLVFVEVRYRKPGAPVGPAESITAAKRRRIAAAAAQYLGARRIPAGRPCRFDVVAVSDRIEWIRSAFDV